MKRLVVLLALLIAGCGEDEAVVSVSPVQMSADAVGHYCQMNVLAHEGPKAQVHLRGNDQPLWFVQIRDAFAFDRMPEQPADVAAIFVSDMGAPGATWDSPGADNWIPAASAFYVVGSAMRGGMGAPDFIPFGSREAAQAFASRHGGTVVAYAGITDEAVLAPVDVELSSDNPTDSKGG